MHSSAGGQEPFRLHATCRNQNSDIPMTTISAKFITGNDLFEQATNVLPLMDAFEELPSLKAVVEKCAQGLREEGFAFGEKELFRILEEELWWQADVRHEASWLSEGICEELKAASCPVTVEESLDAAFRGYELDIQGLIENHGLKEAPLYLEQLWGPDTGYFYVAHENPEAVIESWRRLGVVDEEGNLL